MAKTAAQAEQAEVLGVAEVFRRHGGDVARWASRLGGPGVELEDVVQEVFLKVHQLLPGWSPERAQVTTWLYRITENVVRHRRRKERMRRWLGGSAVDVGRDVPSPARTAEEQLVGHQTQARFYRALEGMNERYRAALILFELEGLSGEEIAALMDAKTATVWVWLHRARADFLKRLQRIMEEEGG
ncbi:RNA polymerase sigma factor [Hyalangium versicolor]|uniref:RNA polymerase sigma factor n=1 Tax=Hyalangium versicolor TaxID=2861190 RepID=UPI001CCF7725|nr:RNA polymerase sigma factor [Hyalangium versicolor]